MRGGMSAFALALFAAACGVSSNETDQNRNPQQVTLRVTTSGSGLVRGAGSDCRSSCSAQYVKGSQVHLVAVPDADSSFSGWSGACSGTAACDLTLDADRDLAATFAGSPPPPPGQRRLTVIVQGHGRVTSRPAGLDCDSSTCSADFADGISISLDAAPASGFNFDGWGAGCSGPGGCTLTLRSDRAVYANFTAQQPPPPPPPSQAHLVASVSGPGTVTGGGLNCGESTATCDVTLAGGSTVTLTASPAGRTRFMGWGGACSGTTTTCELTVNADTKVTAEFQSEVMALAPSDGTNIYPVMALNSTRLFWPRWTNGSAIWSMPKKGGEAVRVVAASVTAMAADDAYLYWTDQHSLYSVPVGGGEVAQLASAWPIEKLALDEVGALYWTVGPGIGTNGSVHRMQNRADSVIASDQYPAGAVAVDADYVYFATSTASGAVRRVPRKGGTVESLLDCAATCSVYGVRVDAENVYWREAYSGKVFARDKKTGAVRTLNGGNGSDGSTVYADLQVNAGVVYWNRIGGLGPVYGIFRVNGDGTGFGAVDSSNDAAWYGLAVDDDAVYYFHASSIIRRLK